VTKENFGDCSPALLADSVILHRPGDINYSLWVFRVLYSPHPLNFIVFTFFVAARFDSVAGFLQQLFQSGVVNDWERPITGPLEELVPSIRSTTRKRSRDRTITKRRRGIAVGAGTEVLVETNRSCIIGRRVPSVVSKKNRFFADAWFLLIYVNNSPINNYSTSSRQI